MVSKNNFQQHQQAVADRVPHYGIRKLSVGVASVLLSTTLYMGVTAHADTTVSTSPQPTVDQPANTTTGTSTSDVTADAQPTAGQPASTATPKNDASAKSAPTALPKQPANATDAQPTADHSSRATNSPTPENDMNVKSAPTALPKQPANTTDAQPTAATSGVQPFVNLAVESDNNDLTPTHETIDSKWTLHYVNQADHKQELKDPTVITMQYTRTNTPQSDGTTQYGDWSYVPGSFKQTGTPITVNDSNNPVKQDNIDKDGENFDVFTITAMYPTVAGYGFYNGINGTRLHDNLRNNERQADSMSKDFYAEYDVAKQPDVVKPTRETVGSQWRIHYIDSTNREHELKAPTVINLQYARTNTPQSDGTIQHGDWSYVPGSFKQTGTPITVNDSNNPVKQDNVDKDGKNEDVFTITAMYPTITGYNFHGGINNVRLHDHLLNYDSNGNIQMPTMGRDFYVEYDPISERSVAVKFVDDQSYDPGSSDGKTQVGQAVTLTGRDGDTVKVNVTVPDKYELADGQQLPTSYTFAKGSGDLKIHLVHKVVQREAAIDVQLMLTTFVRTRSDDNDAAVQEVVTQTRWKQLGDDAEHLNVFLGALPVVGVGTLTGHVDYDLVDETVVSLKDDWTSLNLSGHSYQLPNGTEVVNGIRVDASDTMGKKLRDDWYLNEYRKWHSDVDPDYITRPWYGYLSVNETNNERNSDYGIMSDVRELGLQAGLVGDEPNALAKVIGDRAATSVKISKNIDLNLLQGYNFDFSEQDGQLQAKALLPVAGIYIPYVEKTATRTINVTTPDGKTTAVKQTATLAKQVDFADDAHPAWTTGEWANYDVPTIPGYTPSQSQVAKETVTGETEDQTVNITYTANSQTSTLVYQTEDGTPVHTTTVNGHTGQTVKVSNEVPVGWHIVNGEVPSEITFGPDGAPKTVVTISHSHATVTPDTPKTPSDKLPDNPDKSYPAGVSHDDLNKTVTGTIKVTMPDGQIKTVVKTAKLTRTADVDEVTGKVTYSDWTTGKWSAYTAPSVPGYTANYPYIAGQLVNGETEDQTIEITYTANSQTTHINYVDIQGKLVHTTTVNGQTSQTVDVPSEVPTGWKLVDGQTVPSEVTFGPDGHADTSVKIEHRHVTVTPDKPQTNGTKLPDNSTQSFHGVEASDLNKTVTRTIKVTTPDGQTNTIKQTVKLTRNATVDEVTGDVNYGDWSTGKWDVYTVPTVKGYTATRTEVAAIPVNDRTADQTINVTYTPNAQKLSVKFVDDTTGQVLKTVAKTGVTNANVGYNTQADIQSYEGQHYVLVSDSSNGANLVFDNDDNTDQAYEVHLKHGTHKIDEHHTITQTVHYIATDHASVPDDHTVSVQFDRDGYHDEVTGQDHWNAWKQGGTQTFSAVPTPAKTGYTPDIETISAVTVKPTDPDQKTTVTYTPDTQKLDIVFIDDTTGKTLKTVAKSGPTNSNVGYNTKSDINSYEGQHYVLVSDSSNGASLAFDDQTGIDQHYEVHLKHGTHQVSDRRIITETVHYKMADGTQAPEDHTANVQFDRTGSHDEVTGVDTWNTWTPSATQQFAAVPSPAVSGYTPDTDQVAAQTVGPDAKDTAVTVTYSPNVQIAHVKYIDDTDHKVLTQDDLNGRTGETSGYRTTDRIIEFKGQRYKFVSDNYPVDGMTFDNNDHVDQQYEVHLVHDTRTDEQDVNVPRTITYVYQSGQQAQPDHTDSLKFHETKVVDLVDGHTVSDAWTQAQDFETVTTPTIQGYTPDRANVSNIGITHGHPAITEKVTYNPDTQKAVVKYIDDTTGEQLSAKDLSGYSDESTGYTTKDAIDGYTAKRYVLVSDGTQGQTIAFDHDDSADQVYEVHFKHGTEPTSESRTKKIVVHYSYVDGLARTGKAADDQIATDLTFSRTGTHDLVTDHIAWNAWDKSSQTFDAINSPAIQGYTPDRTVIDNVKVNPDSHDLTEVTVTYNADSQKLSVDFIDDTTGKTLKTINKIGYSDKNAGYNAKSDIQDFISKHYDLISDQTNGENLVFDLDDKTDQHYEVHLTHHLTPITDSREVNKTIHYQYADGAAQTGKAADDYNAQALNFSRAGNHDDVTGIDHWNAWTPASQNFNEVQSPVIAGYTPDKSVIDQQAVNAESPNIDLTVTYAPDAQKLDVVYIDDTEGGKVLKTVTKNGVSDEAAGYNTKSDINALEGLHYNVVSDSTNGANLVFDHDDATDQHYEVHLTHATKPISEAKSINETIRYQLADGTKAFDDYTAKVNFSRTGFNDLVTNIDHWNDWTPAVEQNFNAVQSPVKQGYTPDHAQIDAIKVHPGDADTARTVIYSPDAQTVTIDYLDDVTGKTLQTKTITGVSDVDTGYTTAETINNYEGQHYKLVSDNTNGDQLVFDHDDATDQHYEVHLTHTYKSVNDSATVNEVIHYQYADGTQAKPDHKAEALNFSRTGTQDLVDNSIAWNAWTPSQQVFTSVNTPTVGGYTPDIETVAPVTVSHDTPDVERTVIYHADDQTILVHYIDDDTQSTLKTDSIIGKTSQKSGYETGKTIDGYKQAGYDLVSDDTNGDELVFDNDSTKAQVYNVHLKHRHQAASDSDTVKQTVHYVYDDGSKAADDYTATPIEFTRTGNTDLVTGKTTWNAWTPASQTFKAVPSPVIAGYTPGRATIDHIDVHAGDPDIDETVTYVPDAQRIVVNYIDSVTHQTLKTDTLDGRSDQSTNYNTQKNIDGHKNQHYTLVSDDTQGQNLVFDHDDQATQVYNVVLGHETETVHRAHTVSETIDYKYADGTEAAPTKTAEPKTFSQSGVHDLVTNTTDWNGQWTAPQTFNAVDSPQITGFTPDHASIDAVTVDHDSQDVHKLVVYTANKQAAKINYIDDVTGETLETDTAAGHFGEQISFGRDVNDQIKQFENQGYKLVSNNFNGQKYQADDSNNVFEVHLTHQHQAVSEPDTVTETVKYQYADGTQAAKDSTQSAEFTRTGDKDLVTGTIVWMPSTETHQFDAVDSPAIDGFTPDVQSVPAATVKFGDRDITKVVTYTANDQNAGIKIIDDTTGDVLNTQTATGKFGQTIEFKIDPDTQVADLQGQGYELVSDNFSHQKYQSDNTKNQFEIHVRHQIAPVTRTSTVTETVHYHDRNGHQLVPDTHATKTFTETGVTDKVTGKTTWNATGTQTFNTVKVPTVTGYTPDRTEIPSVDVHFGDHDIDEAVIYTPDSETAQIKYIDDVTGEVLLTDNTTGDYGSTIEFDHNPSSQINQYESQGYKLVSNSYGDQTHQFSATPSDNQFEVHLTHQTKDVSRTKTVTRTINYVDAQTGNKLRPSDQQTLTFTEHGIMDLVTGKTTWVTAPVQHFAKVAVSDIDGYAHQMQTVDSQTADFDSDDFEVTVPYTKIQTPNVPDTGTPTGSQSTPGTVTPTGGENIPTGTQTINGQRQVISTADEPQHQPVQNNSQAQTLPQTGNSKQNGTALVGLGLIGMVGSLFGFKKKRD